MEQLQERVSASLDLSREAAIAEARRFQQDGWRLVYGVWPFIRSAGDNWEVREMSDFMNRRAREPEWLASLVIGACAIEGEHPVVGVGCWEQPAAE